MTEGAAPPSDEGADAPATEGADAPATEGAGAPATEGADAPAAEGAGAPAAPTPQPTVGLQKSLDERKAALDAALARFGAQGWRIENRSEFQATIAKGHRINHVLHLILTIVTLGIWAIVWILLAIFRGEKRQLVTVDDFGNIVATKV
jgi:hypothetical protein